MLMDRDQMLQEQREQYEQIIANLEQQLTDAKLDEDMMNEAKRCASF